jgi:hypothetical protein
MMMWQKQGSMHLLVPRFSMMRRHGVPRAYKVFTRVIVRYVITSGAERSRPYVVSLWVDWFWHFVLTDNGDH